MFTNKHGMRGHDYCVHKVVSTINFSQLLNIFQEIIVHVLKFQCNNSYHII